MLSKLLRSLIEIHMAVNQIGAGERERVKVVMKVRVEGLHCVANKSVLYFPIESCMFA